MSIEYLLKPKDGEFPEEAVREIETYLRTRFPTYRRSDGVYVCAPDEEYRDSVVRRGGEDETGCGCDCFFIGKKGLELSLEGNIEMTCRIAEFLRWCQERWPCELSDESVGRPLTVDTFLAEREDYWFNGPKVPAEWAEPYSKISSPKVPGES